MCLVNQESRKHKVEGPKCLVKRHGMPSRGSRSQDLAAALTEHFEDVSDNGNKVRAVLFIVEFDDF